MPPSLRLAMATLCALLALALAAGRRGDTALERRYRRSAAAAATHSSGP